ncbi:MAG: serine/threonine protein kinase, partial [Gimesia chilikensis]
MNDPESKDQAGSPGDSSLESQNVQAPAGDLDDSLQKTLRQSPAEREQAAHLSKDRLSLPAKVPGYLMVRSLGEGSYGSVWLAQEENTGKYVAIKFYTYRRGLDWSLLNREVEKLAELYTSRNIIS